jgi:putative peptide zinc metalloprotease protein
MTTSEPTAVSACAGTLRTDLQVVPQPAEPRPRILIRNPTTGRIYIFPELSYRILSQLGPGVSIRQAITSALGHGEPPDALLHSITKLVAEATNAGLLAFPEDNGRPRDATPPSKQSLLTFCLKFNPLFIKLNVFNPQKWSNLLAPLARMLFSLPALGLCIASVLAMAIFAAKNRHEYISTFSLFDDFKWWPAVYAVMLTCTIIHEFGHLLACRRFGVDVTEMGILVYLFIPGAFADISGAAMLPDLKQRLVISLGGVYVEAFLWALTTLLWFLATPHSALRGLAFAVNISLIVRLVFNLVPFVKLDGYWVICDLLRMPNLYPKSFRYLFSFVPIFGKHVQFAKPPSRKESAIFLSYGLAAFACLCLFLESAQRRFHVWVLHRSPHLGDLIFWCVISLILGLTALHIWQNNRVRQSSV